MRRGLATPGEIARACLLKPEIVRQWRMRAEINTELVRVEHVRKLMMRGNGHENACDRHEASSGADREAVDTL